MAFGIAYGGAEIPLGPDKKAPARFLVFKAGANFAKWGNQPREVFYCDRKAALQVIAAHVLRGHDMVIDFEHQTQPEHQRADGKSPAAGWITGFEWVDDEGLYASAKWTDEAKTLLESAQYRYFSPVWFYDNQTMRVTELKSVALTNTPAMLDLKPLAAKSAKNTKGTKMDQILLALGLNAADYDSESAVAAAIEAIKTLKSQPSEADVADKTAAAVAKDCGWSDVKTAKALTAQVCAVQAAAKSPSDISKHPQFVAMTSQVTALTNAQKTRDGEDFIRAGREAGKITVENEQLWRMSYGADPTTATKLLNETAASVSMGIVTPKPALAGTSTRAGVIKAALAEYPEASRVACGSTRAAYVSSELRAAGMDYVLTDEDKKLIG